MLQLKFGGVAIFLGDMVCHYSTCLHMLDEAFQHSTTLKSTTTSLFVVLSLLSLIVLHAVLCAAGALHCSIAATAQKTDTAAALSRRLHTGFALYACTQILTAIFCLLVH